MSTLSLDRTDRVSGRRRFDSAVAARLRRYVAAQRRMVRHAWTAGAAYDRAGTPAGRRAVLEDFAASIGR